LSGFCCALVDAEKRQEEEEEDDDDDDEIALAIPIY